MYLQIMINAYFTKFSIWAVLKGDDSVLLLKQMFDEVQERSEEVRSEKVRATLNILIALT